MAAAWLSLLLPSTWGDSRGLARGYDYLAASPNAQDQSARNRRLTTAEGVRELVGDSQREKGRKRQGMERVMDKERERTMVERRRHGGKRDVEGRRSRGLQTEKERQWQRGDRRSRNGRAMVEAR